MKEQGLSIVLVHGAWHTPEFYQPAIDALRQRNHDVHCPALPTCVNDVPPTTSMADDVATVRRVLEDLIDNQQREVVVVSHSYGGVVGTEALAGMSRQGRAEKGLNGGVRRLVYMCAFIPHKGQSLAGIFGGGLPPFIEVKDEENLLVIPDPGPNFYNDLPDDESAYWSKRITLHPKTAQFSPVTHEAWREIPVTYIRCEKDAALIPDIQQMMIDSVTKVGVPVTIEKAGASHSPFLSMPQSLADIIDRVAKPD